MAVTDAGRGAPLWSAPRWPGEPLAEGDSHAHYNPLADELVVRFSPASGPLIAVAIKTPGRDYAHLLVESATGAVVGVQVDDLLAWAVRFHPGWRLLAWPDVAEHRRLLGRFVAEVAALHERYG